MLSINNIFVFWTQMLSILWNFDTAPAFNQNIKAYLCLFLDAFQNKLCPFLLLLNQTLSITILMLNQALLEIPLLLKPILKNQATSRVIHLSVDLSLPKFVFFSFSFFPKQTPIFSWNSYTSRHTRNFDRPRTILLTKFNQVDSFCQRQLRRCFSRK